MQWRRARNPWAEWRQHLPRMHGWSCPFAPALWAGGICRAAAQARGRECGSRHRSRHCNALCRKACGPGLRPSSGRTWRNGQPLPGQAPCGWEADLAWSRLLGSASKTTGKHKGLTPWVLSNSDTSAWDCSAACKWVKMTLLHQLLGDEAPVAVSFVKLPFPARNNADPNGPPE